MTSIIKLLGPIELSQSIELAVCVSYTANQMNQRLSEKLNGIKGGLFKGLNLTIPLALLLLSDV